MSESISAEFDGNVIIPDRPLQYPVGQRLHIIIEPIRAGDPSWLLPKLPPELELRPDGAIVVSGSRISLYIVLEAQYLGLGIDEIHERFPSLSRDALGNILCFCQSHQEPLLRLYQQQQSIAEIHSDEDHQGPSLNELRERRRARQSADRS